MSSGWHPASWTYPRDKAIKTDMISVIFYFHAGYSWHPEAFGLTQDIRSQNCTLSV